MKIPFTLDVWLKDKSQKIETRDGRKIHNIWQIKEPLYTNNRKAEVCALIDGEEDALVFFEGGRYLPTTKDTDNPFDLFIVTPEPELSEFEKAVGLEIFDEPFNEKHIKIIKEESAKLLCKVENGTRHAVMNWSEFQKLAQKFIEIGKAEALKDLPRWRVSRAMRSTMPTVMYGDRGTILYKDGFEISISDLEKLQKEDESYE